jgi:hypothetical protein
MLRNATVSEEDNHARFCSPAFRNRFHWWDNAALAGSRASLAELLGQGYEVKATSTLSLTDSKALNEANITPTVLVTLQKGPSIAVCTFGAPFWELIGTAKDDPLHTPERCDVT